MIQFTDGFNFYAPGEPASLQGPTVIPGTATSIAIDAPVRIDLDDQQGEAKLSASAELLLHKRTFAGLEIKPTGVMQQVEVIVGEGTPVVRFHFESLPQSYRPSEKPLGGFLGPGPYAVRIIVRMGRESAETLHVFHIDAVPEVIVGSWAIESVTLAVHPFPVEAAKPLEFSDDWPAAYLTCRVRPIDYTPSDGAQLRVAATILPSRFLSQYTVTFEDIVIPATSGGTECLLEASTIPWLTVTEEYRILVTVSSESRRGSFTAPVAFLPGSIPDRALEVMDVKVAQGTGEYVSQIRLRDEPLRAQVSLAGRQPVPKSDIQLGLFLGVRFRDDPYRVYASSLLAFTGCRAPEIGHRVSPVVEIATIPDNLASASSLAPFVYVAYEVEDTSFVQWYRSPEIELLPDSGGKELLSGGAPVVLSKGNPWIDPDQLSGAHWCTRFPDPADLNLLEEPFRSNISRFITMIRANGASVIVSATRRPRERAYLMHYAWKVGNAELLPWQVPPMAGVPIIWSHPSTSYAIGAAQAMIREFNMAHPAALVSRHTQGLAVDMTISALPKRLYFKYGGFDLEEDIPGPSDGASNQRLHYVGWRYFSVFKLLRDRPHWSSDGH